MSSQMRDEGARAISARRTLVSSSLSKDWLVGLSPSENTAVGEGHEASNEQSLVLKQMRRAVTYGMQDKRAE